MSKAFEITFKGILRAFQCTCKAFSGSCKEGIFREFQGTLRHFSGHFKGMLWHL